MPPTGPQNVIMDGESPFELPRVNSEDRDLAELRKTARFSKTAEFKQLKEHLEGRIDWYQRYLPGNVPAENVPDEERGKYWAIALEVINEFRAVIAAYEQAAQIIKDESAQQKRT